MPRNQSARKTAQNESLDPSNPDNNRPDRGLDEAHRGGTLEEMSARGGTSIPDDAGTQVVDHSSPRSDPMKSYIKFPRGDNVMDMPGDPADQGATGEVLSGTGDVMPPGIEGKHVGETHGGKHSGQERHTFRSVHAKEMGSSGPGHVNLVKGKDIGGDQPGREDWM